MSIDDQIIDSLDEYWRTITQIRSRLRDRGVFTELPSTLQRLAKAGCIERRAMETSLPKRRTSSAAPPHFEIQLFRRRVEIEVADAKCQSGDHPSAAKAAYDRPQFESRLAQASQGHAKKPKDLADEMALRPTAEFVRETLSVPCAEAQKRAKGIFEEFPRAEYLTEIEKWRDVGKDTVELTFKRRVTPLSEEQ